MGTLNTKHFFNALSYSIPAYPLCLPTNTYNKLENHQILLRSLSLSLSVQDEVITEPENHLCLDPAFIIEKIPRESVNVTKKYEHFHGFRQVNPVP